MSLTPSVWYKSVSDKRTLTFDLTDSLATGDSISSCTSTPDSTAVVVTTPITISSPYVYIQVSGGVVGAIYELSLAFITANGDEINEILKIIMKDA